MSIQKNKILIIMLIMSFPIKVISLLFLVLYNIYLLFQVLNKKILVNKKIAIYLLTLFFIQLLLVSMIYSPKFIFNVILYFLFISPILWFIVINKSKFKQKISQNELKRVIETYLKIEIFFSIINMIYRLLNRGFSFDIDFGDIIAGTFRMPFTYQADVSNPIFAFSMIMILIFYVAAYKQHVNKILIGMVLITVFLSSVNHLILAILAAGILSYSYTKILKIFFILISIYFLYAYLQPGNYNMIVERFSKIFLLFSNLDVLNTLGYKGQYIYLWINDYINNFYLFSFLGTGAGTYSSRAAMFFTGEYIHGFPFKIMGDMMENNTFILWKNFLDSPSWMQGSFNYPFNAIFSLIAEIGFVNGIIISILFFKKLKKTLIYSFNQRLFIIFLLFFLGFIDNYYEYFQVFFLYFILHFYFSNLFYRKELSYRSPIMNSLKEEKNK